MHSYYNAVGSLNNQINNARSSLQGAQDSYNHVSSCCSNNDCDCGRCAWYDPCTCQIGCYVTQGWCCVQKEALWVALQTANGVLNGFQSALNGIINSAVGLAFSAAQVGLQFLFTAELILRLVSEIFIDQVVRERERCSWIMSLAGYTFKAAQMGLISFLGRSV